MNEGIVRPSFQLSEDWMALVFLFALFALAWLRARHPYHLSRIWNSAFNIRLMHQSMREDAGSRRERILFSLIYYALVALCVYLLLSYWGISTAIPDGLALYVALLAAVAGLYSLKTLGIRAVRFLAAGDFSLSDYSYSLSVIAQLCGLALFPAALTAAYADVSWAIYPLMMCFGIIGVSVLYRWVRGMVHAVSGGVPVFFIFFYICTLEILPLVVGYKALSS